MTTKTDYYVVKGYMSCDLTEEEVISRAYEELTLEHRRLVKRYREGWVDGVLCFVWGLGVPQEVLAPMPNPNEIVGRITYQQFLKVWEGATALLDHRGYPVFSVLFGELLPAPHDHPAYNRYMRFAFARCPVTGERGVFISTGYILISEDHFVLGGYQREEFVRKTREAQFISIAQGQNLHTPAEWVGAATNLVVEWDHYTSTGWHPIQP